MRLPSSRYVLPSALLIAASLLGCARSRALEAPRLDGEKTGSPIAATPAFGSPGEPADPAEGSPGEAFLGVVLPRHSVEVAADQTGRLLAVEVRVGDALRRGDPIAQLDSRVLSEELEMGRAALRALRADAEQRSAELIEIERRTERRMKAPDLFSSEELDAARRELSAARAALEAAEAQVAGAESRVEQVRARLGETAIRAPFSGTVSQRYVDAGATVAAGDPIIRLIASDDLLVRFAVPPERARSLAPGLTVAVRVRDAGSPLEATVERVSPAIDTASGTIFVEARLSPSGDIPPSAGSVARVRPSTF